MRTILALFALFAVEVAGKKCPSYWDVANPKTMVRFDLTKYSKRWYEHYVTPIEGLTEGCECTIFDIYPKPDGSGNYTDGFSCNRSGTPVALNLTLIPNEVSCEAGKMSEVFVSGFLPEGELAQYWLLDQAFDYQYAIAYACVQVTEDETTEYPFFLSASPEPFPHLLYKYWSLILKSKGVDLTGFEQTPQTNCVYPTVPF